MNAARVLEQSAERDQWERFALELARDAYAAGYRDGRADQAREADRAWAAAPVQRIRDAPSFADLEAVRWTLRGEQRTRETFADPHPDDYKGGPR